MGSFCVVSWESWLETLRSYKYLSTKRKPSDGEMITVFCPQNTAANYVKIITTSKSMSGGGLRGGSPTTHSNTSTHTCTLAQTLFLILSAVIVSPHARCVSAQELTAWGAGYKAWRVIAWFIFRKCFTSTHPWHIQGYTLRRCVREHTHVCTHTCVFQ